MEGAIELADVVADTEISGENDNQRGTLGKSAPKLSVPLQSCIKSEIGGVSGGRGESPSRINKASRRVYFPDGGNFVTKAFEPPNPWDKAKSFTTSELVNDYQRSCEKVNVRPLPKLLNQLQAILDFGERFETLTLKGERLDVRHCETLEEVLRRVQFKTVDLEATHLDDEGAGALFDMIEYYESATKLNIAYNRSIGPRGWQACSRMLKKTPCLENLDARNCLFTEQSMPFLGRALRLGSNLTTLHLESCSLSGRPLLILVGALKLNETLKELFLADNRLMPSDGIQLGNLLKFNHRLQLLDLRNNHLQDVGATHISDGLYEQNLGTGLTTLVLWNNQITYQSMTSLARALYATQSLETLNLGHNSITNEGILALKDGLLKNKSLLRLGIQASKLSCEGAIALAEYIADNKKLLRVDLRENDIKTAGLMALSLSLKVNMYVSRVDIDKDPKKESGVKDYVDQQKRLHQDIQGWLVRNKELSQEREKRAEWEKLNPEKVKPVEPEKVPEEETVNTSRPNLALPIPEPDNRQMTLESPMYAPGSDLASSPVNIPNSNAASRLSFLNADLEKLSPRTRAKKLFTVKKVDESPNSASPTNFDGPLFGLTIEDTDGKVTYASEQEYVESVMHAAVDDLKNEKFPKNLPVPDPLSPLASPDILEPGQVKTVPLIGPDIVPGNMNQRKDDQGTVDFVKRTVDTVKSRGLPRPLVTVTDSLQVDNRIANKTNIPSSGSMEGLLISPDEADDAVFVDDLENKNTDSQNAAKISKGFDEDSPSDMDTDSNGSASLMGASQPLAELADVDASAACDIDMEAAKVSDAQDNERMIVTVCDNDDDDDPMDPGLDDVSDSDMEKSPLDLDELDEKDPDFHTNMTINGMTMELSKVLDSIDTASSHKSPSPASDFDPDDDSGSTPDEFERELDEMLAKVHEEGILLTTGAGSKHLLQGPGSAHGSHYCLLFGELGVIIAPL
ncbi:protein phosphatase 1 regulatory subunit 37-like isoform X2 [Lineus longissimus]|uniref:protein phosphatase 1 regulatory subunit 37-like isoform X2 n=1 Tax=Lineus longissimus TaxID=88925 RepID=UPI00315D74FC